MPELEWTIDGLGPQIEEFLDPVLDAVGFDLGYSICEIDAEQAAIAPEISVGFGGEDQGLLLQRRGELLLALEHLTAEALRIPHQDRHRLLFDVNDRRMLRLEELCLSAKAAAAEVKRTGKRFAFRPMSSRERRIIHIALRDDAAVQTMSEGEPPRRYTVVDSRKDAPQ